MSIDYSLSNHTKVKYETSTNETSIHSSSAIHKYIIMVSMFKIYKGNNRD